MTGLHHLDLNVSDVDRSAAFYDRILTQMGFTRIEDSSGEEAGSDWISPSEANIGYFSIGIVPAKNRGKPHDRYAPRLHHLALKAAAREAAGEVGPTLLPLCA